MYGNTGDRQPITTNTTNSPEMRRPRRAKDGNIIPSTKIRAYVYGVMVAASPIVIYYGVATIEEVGLWIAFGGVALGLSNAVALANTADRKQP